MSGPKDAQIVVRVPAALVVALKAHAAALQEQRPFENVTLAVAVRDLLARALATAPARPSRRKPNA